MTPQSVHSDAYMKLQLHTRLLCFNPNPPESTPISYNRLAEPESEARWIVEQMHDGAEKEVVYFLRGALTGELTRALLQQLPQQSTAQQAEFVVEDATKIFCHPVTLSRLAARGLNARVARVVRVLAITMNPYTPEYSCTPQRFLDALLRELPENCPPVVDVMSGIFHPARV
jgi:hypothetical protein